MEISKAGFDTRSINVTSSAGGWYLLGNLVFGGIIGWLIVDPATGAMWTLSPEQVATDFNEPEIIKTPGKSADMNDASSDTNLYTSEAMRIVLLESVPNNLRPQMVPIN